MSRPMSPKRDFDAQKLVELLTRAQGNRTRSQFAEDCGMSIGHLSRCFHKKLTKPPLPSTLGKIAAVAQNGVTYDSLLDAAGYDVKKYVMAAAKKFNSIPFTPQKEDFKRRGIATIATALAYSKYIWYVDGRLGSNQYLDWMVFIASDCMTKWHFQFLVEMPPKNPNIVLLEELLYVYNKGQVSAVRATILHTFVTESPLLFDLLVANPPKCLGSYASVMLIDTTSLKIVKTEYIKGTVDGVPNLPVL